ncbi:VCBS domain-containing protein, partial [Vibrio sp. FJH11]
TGQYGRFSIDEQGHWTYSADNSNPAIQALGLNGQGEIVERFTVSSADGSASRDVVVRIMGTNDGPVVNHAISGAVADEDTAFSLTVPSDTFTDIDIGDTLTLSTGTLPTWLHFDATTGTFSGTPTNSDVGSTPVTVTATDEHGAQVSTTFDLTVNNVNDAPVMTPVSTTVHEGAPVFHDHLAATDPDVGDLLTYSTTSSEPGFTLHADGRYSFDCSNNAYNHLAAGQQQDVIIPIKVTDSSGSSTTSSLTITIVGTDDAPEVSGRYVGQHVEDESIFSRQLHVYDPDSNGPFEFTTTSTVAGFTLLPDGHWSFDPGDAAYQTLAQGEPKTIVIPITVTDSRGAGTTKTDAITIKLTGTNDTPAINHVITGQIADEDTAFSFT